MATSTRNLLIALVGIIMAGIFVLLAIGRPIDTIVSTTLIMLVSSVVGVTASKTAAEARDVGSQALTVAQRVEAQTNGILADAVHRLPESEQHRTAAVQQGFVAPPPKSESGQLPLDEPGTAPATR